MGKSVSVKYHFWNISIFLAPSPIPGRDRRVGPLTFCTKCIAQELLLETFFDKMGIFGSL